MTQVFRLLRDYWKALVTLFFLPVVGNVFAGELRDWSYVQLGWKTDGPKHLWATTLVTGVLLFVVAVVAAAYGRDLFRPRNVALGSKRNPVPHSHLVLFLSNLPTQYANFIDGVPAGLGLSGRLDADMMEMERLKKLDPKSGQVRWLWEMPLRGLKQHREKLTTVTLICSMESLKQVHWFAKILTTTYAVDFPLLSPDKVRVLARSGPNVHFHANPSREACDPANMAWDFEDYEELYDALLKMMTIFNNSGVRESEVMIDVTGGQKPNSVVGALLTVNRRAKFQYVQTNDPYDVIAYDLMTEYSG
jgi:hypothetical protein